MCIEAYTAGLIDGDGCITVSRPKPTRCQLIVNLSMCDREPLELVAEEFGGKVSPGKLTRTGRRVWQWRLSGVGAKWFLEQIRPWLVGKAPQANLALTFPVQPRGTHARRPGSSYGQLSEEDSEAQQSIYAQMKVLHNKV